MGNLTDVTESYKRCLRDAAFFDRFYARLFERVPEVAPLFEKVEFSAQRIMIRKGITNLLLWASGTDGAEASLREIHHTHGPGGLDLDPGLYRHWLEALIQTVAETDPAFTPQLGQSWRDVLADGLRVITTGAP